jgi:hypothetical protein
MEIHPQNRRLMMEMAKAERGRFARRNTPPEPEPDKEPEAEPEADVEAEAEIEAQAQGEAHASEPGPEPTLQPGELSDGDRGSVEASAPSNGTCSPATKSSFWKRQNCQVCFSQPIRPLLHCHPKHR